MLMQQLPRHRMTPDRGPQIVLGSWWKPSFHSCHWRECNWHIQQALATRWICLSYAKFVTLENLDQNHSNQTELLRIMSNSSSASWGDIPSKLTSILSICYSLGHLHRMTHHQYTHKCGNIVHCDGHFTERHVKSIRLRLQPFHECEDNNPICPSVENISQPLQSELMNIRNKMVILCVIILIGSKKCIFITTFTIIFPYLFF